MSQRLFKIDGIPVIIVDAVILQALRDQGVSNKAILEILGVIGLYTFLNYAKHLTQPVLDFLIVAEFQPVAKY